MPDPELLHPHGVRDCNSDEVDTRGQRRTAVGRKEEPGFAAVAEGGV